MRTRTAGETLIRHVLALTVLVAGVACDNRTSPSRNSPNNPVAPAPVTPTATVTSIAITGATRLSQPGDTSQLTMTATFSDGTTRDVTAEARWGYGGQITISQSGVITARGYGRGHVFSNTYRNFEPNVTEVRVMPEGSFLVTGRVREGGVKVEDARVSGTSASGTVTTMSYVDGAYELAPLSGEVVIRVEKDGYVAQAKTLIVQGDDVADFELPRGSAAAGSIDGVYALTFTAAPSCTMPPGALPPELMRRTYLARITEKADGLVVDVDGPGFPYDFWRYGFKGQRDGSTVRFDLNGSPNSPNPWNWESDYLLMESLDGGCLIGQTCGPQRFLGYTGTATGTIGERSITMVFNGTVRLWGSGVALCAGGHRLEFVR
jgi:hypothetical protein